MIVWSSHRLFRIALALVLAIVVIWGSDRLAHAHVHQAAQEIVQEFLIVGLTPYVLGDESRPPDDLSLYLWMHQIQPQLAEQLATSRFCHWACPGTLELLWIVRIGDTAAVPAGEWNAGQEPRIHTIQWRVGDNHYEAAWTGEYARDPATLMAIGAFSLVAFLLVGWLLPAPLGSEQRAWFARLMENEVDAHTALKVAKNPHIPAEGISAEADTRFEQLRASGVAAATAMEWVLSEAVADLSETQWAWFLIGLNKPGAEFELSLELARKPDSLEIRYEPPSVWLRGIEVSMPAGRRTYYALYAQRRARGDGWVENPGASKPGQGSNPLGDEFLNLTKLLETHEKARLAVERKGISASDLTSSRNRIKDDILKSLALPESVSGATELTALAAGPYLFEKQALPDKERSAFRIPLDSALIRLG